MRNAIGIEVDRFFDWGGGAAVPAHQVLADAFKNWRFLYSAKNNPEDAFGFILRYTGLHLITFSSPSYFGGGRLLRPLGNADESWQPKRLREFGELASDTTCALTRNFDAKVRVGHSYEDARAYLYSLANTSESKLPMAERDRWHNSPREHSRLVEMQKVEMEAERKAARYAKIDEVAMMPSELSSTPEFGSW
jgi:hypothetical protein